MKEDGPSLDRIRDQLTLKARVHGFFESAVIFALVELKIFEHLSDGTLSLGELSQRASAREDSLARLMRAACGMQLVERRADGRFRIPSRLQPFLGRGESEESVIPWVRFIQSMAPRLFDIAEVVRHGPPSLEGDDYCLWGADLDSFSRAMHLYASTLGSELVRFLDLSGAKSLLDLACGSGTYAFLLGRHNPHLSLCLMDSAGVLEVARRTAQKFQITNQVEFRPADILVDPIRGEFDVILISNTLHLIGPAAARELLGRCFHAVRPGGSLVVQGQFLKVGQSEKGWPVMLDLILLTSSSSGRNHDPSETGAWLEEAGFEAIEFQPMSLTNVNSYVRGFKGGASKG